MKIRSEISVGLIALGTILVGIWGINYLKGRNILKQSYSLHVSYPAADGLEASASVQLRGVKIGYVESVILDMEEERVNLCLEIQSEFPLPEESIALLVSTDLLGTRGIRIEPGDGPGKLDDGDTIKGYELPGMLQGIQGQVEPLIRQAGILAGTLDTMARSLDTLVGSLNGLLSSGRIHTTLDNLEGATGSLEEILESDGSLQGSLRNLESLSATLDTVGKDLGAAKLDSIGMELHAFLIQANTLVKQINSGEGSAGALVYSDSLHNAMISLVSGLDSLARDLNENPEDYVQISVFGKNGKKEK